MKKRGKVSRTNIRNKNKNNLRNKKTILMIVVIGFLLLILFLSISMPNILTSYEKQIQNALLLNKNQKGALYDYPDESPPPTDTSNPDETPPETTSMEPTDVPSTEPTSTPTTTPNPPKCGNYIDKSGVDYGPAVIGVGSVTLCDPDYIAMGGKDTCSVWSKPICARIMPNQDHYDIWHWRSCSHDICVYVNGNPKCNSSIYQETEKLQECKKSCQADEIRCNCDANSDCTNCQKCDTGENKCVNDTTKNGNECSISNTEKGKCKDGVCQPLDCKNPSPDICQRCDKTYSPPQIKPDPSKNGFPCKAIVKEGNVNVMKDGFCSDGVCTIEKTCTSMNLPIPCGGTSSGGLACCASDETCCKKGSKGTEVCCKPGEACKSSYSKSYCDPYICPSDKKLCKGKDWSSCCNKDAVCVITNILGLEIADCGKSQCDSSIGEHVCPPSSTGGNGVICCKSNEECIVKYGYPSCSATYCKAGESLCSAGNKDMKNICCKKGKENCVLQPNGAPNCRPIPTPTPTPSPPPSPSPTTTASITPTPTETPTETPSTSPTQCVSPDSDNGVYCNSNCQSSLSSMGFLSSILNYLKSIFLQSATITPDCSCCNAVPTETPSITPTGSETPYIYETPTDTASVTPTY